MERNSILKKHLSLGIIYKLSGMFLSYFSIPLFLKYLGDRDYGLWMVIFSIVSWISMFDLGIGNGLKNKLTKDLTEKNFFSAREYITTGYLVIILISSLVLILGIIGINVGNLSKILNIDNYSEVFLKKLVLIVFVLTVINFILGLYRVLYMAKHDSTIGNFSNILFQILFIFCLYILKHSGFLSLLTVAIIYPGINTILSLIFTFKFFKENKNLTPNFKFFKKSKIKEITSSSVYFFIIQIAMLIILTTDNIIITKLIGVEAVTPYSIISKLFQIFMVVTSIVLTPLWTLFLDAYLKKDKKWIINILKKLNILYLLLVVVVVLTIPLTPYIIKLWTGKEMDFPKYLITLFGTFILIRTYADIYAYFINGIGKIKLQTYLFSFGAIANIPLSIFFVKNLNLGSSGVILATNICMLPLAIFIPIQAFRIIKNMKAEE